MSEMVTVATSKGAVQAYLAKPDGHCRGGVIVIHEVWGLTDHIKDIADRLATEGYLALAPDLLSDVIDVTAISGLQEGLFNPEKRNAIQPHLRKLMAPIHNESFGEDTLLRLDGIFNYLYGRPEPAQKIAVLGFCFGGTYSFGLAVKEPRLLLALPFYGHSNYNINELSMLACPVRAFYGEKDENLMKDLPELKVNMQKARVNFLDKVYPGCGHAFFNDTNRFAYNQAAAADAWQLSLNYLKKYLG